MYVFVVVVVVVRSGNGDGLVLRGEQLIGYLFMEFSVARKTDYTILQFNRWADVHFAIDIQFQFNCNRWWTWPFFVCVSVCVCNVFLNFCYICCFCQCVICVGGFISSFICNYNRFFWFYDHAITGHIYQARD